MNECCLKERSRFREIVEKLDDKVNKQVFNTHSCRNETTCPYCACLRRLEPLIDELLAEIDAEKDASKSGVVTDGNGGCKISSAKVRPSVKSSCECGFPSTFVRAIKEKGSWHKKDCPKFKEAEE